MQHNGAARNACLPDNHWRTRQNGDILREIGLDNSAIQALNDRSRAAGCDAIVRYCEEKGISSLEGLLT